MCPACAPRRNGNNGKSSESSRIADQTPFLRIVARRRPDRIKLMIRCPFQAVRDWEARRSEEGHDAEEGEGAQATMHVG
jgi:hypothetical protein